MKSKTLITGLLTATMLSASVVPASAHDFHRGWGHGGGRDGGLLFGLIGGAVVAAATIVTLPVRVVADAASGPAPAPAPVYAAPMPVYYQQGGYYADRPRQVVYAYPQTYAYPTAPAYYYPGY